jgi:DNA-binding protein YbaB
MARKFDKKKYQQKLKKRQKQIEKRRKTGKVSGGCC